MSPDPALLVAFLNGTAAVGAHPRTKWWRDAEVQARLELTADQVQALEQISAQAAGEGLTQMLWRMYQTLSLAQRRQFSQLLRRAV